LADLINETKPDAVHVLGLGVHWRNMAEPILDAFDSGLRMPCPLVYSSWGTDLECFARLPEQTADVRRFLERVDVHVPECARDARLARELGFKGRTWMSLPAFGGVDLQRAEGLMMPRDLVDRRTVILKGRDHTGEYGDPIGRAMTAVQAFDVCVDALRGYRIVVVQANRSVAEACNTLRLKTGLDVQVWPRVAYEELMRCFGQARAVISLTVNDGLPGILVEAMTAGALPLHSELEPIREWIVHGENGLLVPPDDVGAAAAALRRALTDDELVRRAAERNREIVRTRLDAGIVRQRAIEMYEKVANRGVQTAVYGTSQFGVQGV
jgi:glycosyltransferase involved in cell wall biosynthesis